MRLGGLAEDIALGIIVLPQPSQRLLEQLSRRGSVSKRNVGGEEQLGVEKIAT